MVRNLRALRCEEELKKELIDIIIGAGAQDPTQKGPVVVRIKLPDGRAVKGAYHRCEENELGDIIWDDNALRLFVETLLKSGAPFVTEMGSHDAVCTLRWTIE